VTNIISVGVEEQERFVAAKGIPAVHYLMFSDNMMIRRAATEAICNMCSHSDTLKLLRNSEQLRLWLGFCQEWDTDGADVLMNLNEHIGDLTFAPYYYTAQAAAGTLAMACDDIEVTVSMISDRVDCAKGLKAMLNSRQDALVLRALVVINKMCGSHGYDDESLTNLVSQLRAGTHFDVTEMKQLESILADWTRVTKVRIQAVEYLVGYEIINCFASAVSDISGDNDAVASLVKEIIENITYVMQNLRQQGLIAAVRSTTE